MVIGKIKPVATIVAQFAAGVEVEAIQHDGKLFFPVTNLGDFSAIEKTSSPAPSKSEPAARDEKSEKSTTKANTKSYTKEELMDTDSKELIRILKNDFGINPDDFEGKNTNKKLRDLILEAQSKGTSKDDDAEEETEDTEKSSEDNELVDQVAQILEDFDAGKKNKKKAISSICSLVDDADEEKVTELVEEFEDDADADLEEMAEKIADVLSGKKEEKPKKSASPKRGAKKSKEEDLVEVDDLEVGDRVSVWWDDDNQAWFDGEVKSIKKGKVVIAYDDDTEEPIDPEVHTKIKRLAE